MSRNAELKRRARLYVEAVIVGLAEMPDKQFNSLIGAMGRLTKTNCGWSEYRVAELIRAELPHIYQARRRRRQAKKASGSPK